MLYFLVKAIEGFMDPSLLFVIFATLGFMLLLIFRHSKVGYTFLSIGIAALAACTFLPVGTWLMRPLEDRFPRAQGLPAQVSGLIVLGGAIDLTETAGRGEPALNDASGRMTTFLKLARRYPKAKLVFTGGNPSLQDGALTEASVADQFFQSQGLDVHRLLLENASRNTHENALYSMRLVRPRSSERWVLITSAADLPRAVGSFRSVGWHVTAYPTDYHTSPFGPHMNPGLVGGMRRVDWATHEWLGLIYYWLKGWTPELFPGPRGE